MTETHLVEIHAIVRGRVQGVGFRATTYRYAIDLGLKGTVRNIPDGTVEIHACGPQKTLDQLIKKLKDTFFHHIQSMELHFQTAENHYEGFSILYTHCDR